MFQVGGNTLGDFVLRAAESILEASVLLLLKASRELGTVDRSYWATGILDPSQQATQSAPELLTLASVPIQLLIDHGVKGIGVTHDITETLPLESLQMRDSPMIVLDITQQITAHLTEIPKDLIARLLPSLQMVDDRQIEGALTLPQSVDERIEQPLEQGTEPTSDASRLRWDRKGLPGLPPSPPGYEIALALAEFLTLLDGPRIFWHRVGHCALLFCDHGYDDFGNDFRVQLDTHGVVPQRLDSTLQIDPASVDRDTLGL